VVTYALEDFLHLHKVILPPALEEPNGGE